MLNIVQMIKERFGFLSTGVGRMAELQRSVSALKREVCRCRNQIKVLKGQPIHVVFVCHNPSLWGKLSPIHSVIEVDPDFKLTIVAVPYRHSVSWKEEFKDGGMAAYLEKEGTASTVAGYDKETGRWLDLQDLAPDYVFFQTPYEYQFPSSYSAASVSSFARVCYVPYYGILIYRGEVEEITHPVSFFSHTNLVLVGHKKEREELLERFPETVGGRNVVVVGSPMLDFVKSETEPDRDAWNQPDREGAKRVLWTPRWRTTEGNCHFFEYKDYFLDLANEREEVDFLFRPHPLCLQNFVTSGEFPEAEQKVMVDRYAKTANAAIDTSPDYRDILRTTDILVSDMSSMLVEFFVTGSPIIYTHRVDTFNDFGRELAKGFYWVRDQKNLDETLGRLLRGEDPLRETREKIIEELFFFPPEGSANLVAKLLKHRFLD